MGWSFGTGVMSKIKTQAIFFDNIGTLVKDADDWKPGAKGVLEKLGANGFRLGLISNTGDFDRIG